MKTIKIGDWEYETEDHNRGLIFKKAVEKCPKGWKLWGYKDCVKLYNSKYTKKLNLNNCWFFIEQPFKFNKEMGWVAGFVAGSGRAVLDCLRYPDGSGAGLGVRFKRRIKK